MKPIFPLFIMLILFSGCKSKTEVKFFEYPITPVPVKNVEMNDNFWLPKIKLIQKTTIQYAFDKCKNEGRMDNFLIAGGKMKGPVKGKMPFDDTDLYKIIEGASYTLISSPDPILESYLDSVIDIIKIGQEPDGYLTTWFTIDRTKPPAWWVNPSTTRWENEISSHELYNSGHLFEAAAAHYLATGKRNLLDIALKNADLLVDNFGPDKLTIVPGHQIVETGLIKLYQITNNDKYLELAKYYLDWRGDTTTHKLYGAYNQDHLPVTVQSEVTGHAVRGVYMYAAMTDIAAIYHDPDYFKAVSNLWNNMVEKKIYLTGGIGARHEGESFGDNYELPNQTAYSETCAAIGSVYWCHRLFLLTGDVKYYDIIERTLYNALIAGISADGIKFFYPNPLESDGVFDFNKGSCTRQEWFDCSCCPTNLIRFIPSIPGLIYATNADTLFVNLYASNSATINLSDNTVSISQVSDFPWKGNVTVQIDLEKRKAFTLKLRIPYWTTGRAIPGNLYRYTDKLSENTEIRINGNPFHNSINKGYATIRRNWNPGDKIEIIFHMQIRNVIADTLVKDDLNKRAIEYGPFAYCAEEADNRRKMDNIIVPESMTFYVDFRNNLFNGMNTLVSDMDSLVLIPYYAWSNRGIGKMNVWFLNNR